MADEKLLDRGSDLRFWRPTGVGFMRRSPVANVMSNGSSETCQYLIRNDLKPRSSMKQDVLSHLEVLAHLAMDGTATTFWALHRGDDYQDESLLVLSLFANKSQAKAFETGAAGDVWRDVESKCSSRKRTTWLECGIGFVGRE